MPIGCFKDTKKPRPLPVLIKNFRGHLDWNNLNTTIDACAEEAKKRGCLYFAVQFYGECWCGPKAHLTYDRDGPSKNCFDKFNVGKQRTNFVYMLAGVGKSRSFCFLGKNAIALKRAIYGLSQNRLVLEPER